MLETMGSLRDLNTVSLFLRLVLAMAAGGLIGMERGKKRRPAGFRTYMLVCMGSALTMMLGQYEYQMLMSGWAEAHPEMKADAARFGAQVINGIGFLGAGTIIVTGKQEVKGLTTAAGLWASACMGLAIGVGFYECILLSFLLIFLTIRFLPFIEMLMLEKSRNINLYIEFDSLDHIGKILDRIKEQSVHIYEVEIDHGRGENARYPSAAFTLRLNKRQKHTELLAAIAELECIRSIDEI